MRTAEQIVFVGVHGTVLALDRSTGEEIWRAKLKSSDFVNVVLDGDQILATSKGEIFSLDALTGVQRWHNKLPGLGLGLMTMVTAASTESPIASEAEARRRKQQAAAAASSAAIVP